MPEQMIEDFVPKEEEQEKRKNKNEKAALRRLWRGALGHEFCRRTQRDFKGKEKQNLQKLISMLLYTLYHYWSWIIR
jgi:muconolactone delta-isomerase